MKKLFALIIVLALLLAGGTSYAQISAVLAGTNLAVVAQNDTANSPVIAGPYAGGVYTMINGSGGTNYPAIIPPTPAITYFTNSAGGVAQIVNPAYYPHGDRVCAFFYSMWTNNIGLTFGNYTNGQTPDRILVPTNGLATYFEDGYDGIICARSLTTDGGGSLTYSDIGNLSPGGQGLRHIRWQTSGTNVTVIAGNDTTSSTLVGNSLAGVGRHRVAFYVGNTNVAGIVGVKLNGVYASGATPESQVGPGQHMTFLLGDGYDGVVSMRCIANATKPIIYWEGGY